MSYGTLASDVIQSSTTGTPPQFNDGSGTQIGTLCRAWVNFDGTTNPGTIRGSFNVSSVTVNGTGDYNVNFTNSMPDTHYSTVSNVGEYQTTLTNRLITSNTINSSSVRVMVTVASTGSAYNDTSISTAVFR